MPVPISRLLVAVLAVTLPLAAAAQKVDPKVSPDFEKRRALVKSAYRPTMETSAKLPPVGLLGKEQFRLLGAAWAQFHRSVAAGNVEVLRTVVRNARACRDNSLAVKAEMLMESRVRLSSPEGTSEKTMGEWIMAIGPRLRSDQFGETDALFVVPSEKAGRVHFGNVLFVEGEGGHWSIDLGC